MKERFSNSEPKKSFPVGNESKIIFHKCKFHSREEKEELIFKVEIKTPTGSTNTKGKPLYNNKSEHICIDDFITKNSKNTDPVIFNNTYIDIPRGSTIINISFSTLNSKFDLSLYFSVV